MPLDELFAFYGYETSDPISERESEGSDPAPTLPDMTLDKVSGWSTHGPGLLRARLGSAVRGASGGYRGGARHCLKRTQPQMPSWVDGGGFPAAHPGAALSLQSRFQPAEGATAPEVWGCSPGWTLRGLPPAVESRCVNQAECGTAFAFLSQGADSEGPALRGRGGRDAVLGG